MPDAQLDEDVVATEFFRGENARNSLPPSTISGDNDNSRDPLVTVDSCIVRSGVRALPMAELVPVPVESRSREAEIRFGAWKLNRLNGLEKLLGEVCCSGRVLTTLGMRPTWGRRLCFAGATATLEFCTWGRAGVAAMMRDRGRGKVGAAAAVGAGAGAATRRGASGGGDVW